MASKNQRSDLKANWNLGKSLSHLNNDLGLSLCADLCHTHLLVPDHGDRG